MKSSMKIGWAGMVPSSACWAGPGQVNEDGLSQAALDGTDPYRPLICTYYLLNNTKQVYSQERTTQCFHTSSAK